MHIRPNRGRPNLLVETNGTESYAYVYAGRVMSQISAGEEVYYHQDGLGSIIRVTSSSGVVLNHYEYDAFGPPNVILETVHNPFLFTGEPYDDNGLVFLRARYYDPTTGRFLSRDTYLGSLNDPLAQHLYVYVGNNPVLYVDPSGRIKVCSGTAMSAEQFAGFMQYIIASSIDKRRTVAKAL